LGGFKSLAAFPAARKDGLLALGLVAAPALVRTALAGLPAAPVIGWAV